MTPPESTDQARAQFRTLQLRQRKCWWIVFCFCVAAVAVSFALGGPSYTLWAAIAGIVAIVIATVRATQILSQFYKQTIMPEIASQGCENGRYTPDAGISEQLFRESNLFRSPDRYDSEDRIEGCIGQTPFYFAEVHAQERRTTHTKNGTRTTWVDIFRGFFFVADFNKHFQGQTTLVPNYWGSKWLAGKDRVQLENAELMKHLLVCSTDQVEARYLLTPALMERIMTLWHRHPDRLSISFTASNIIVAISVSGNHYEASLWRPIERCIERDTRVVRELTSIVEELNMNTRIWSKA